MSKKGLSRALPVLVFTLGLAFLSFVAGMLAVLGDLYPASIARDAHLGAVALIERQRQLKEHHQLAGGLWEPARTEARGLTRHERGRSFEGLTLYTSAHDQLALLIDMEGREVHSWRVPFSTLRHDGAKVKKPLPDGRIFLRAARMQPNGDLLAVFQAVGDTPYGYGLVKVDRHSRPL